MAIPLALPGWADVQEPSTLPPQTTISEAYIPFADETLAAVEQQSLQTVQQQAGAWMAWLWPWIVGSLAVWSPGRQREWDRMVDQWTIETQTWRRRIHAAWGAGQDAAERRTPPPPAHVVPPRPLPRLSTVTDAERARAAWLAEVTAAAKMREWAEGLKNDVRWQVVHAVRNHNTPTQLAQTLAQRWHLAGVQWQRIATTELSLAYHDGLLAMITPGQLGYVRAIGDAKVCAACHRLLEDHVFRLYPVTLRNPTPDDWQHALWPGKSNFGRKPADWVPCVPLHPQCRHIISVFTPRKEMTAHGPRSDSPHPGTRRRRRR